jgi:lysophospholipase L1-like esterase
MESGVVAVGTAGTSSGTRAMAAPSFNNETVRQLMTVSIGGDAVRIKLANYYGKEPVTFSSVHIARNTTASNIDPISDRTVMFNGKSSVTISPGADVLSDDIAMTVAPLENLAVSMYFADKTTVPTVHRTSRTTSYFAQGDQTTVATFPPDHHYRDSYFNDPAYIEWAYYALTAIETSSPVPANVVAVFGDSVTEGNNAEVDQNSSKRYPSYPNLLDDRLKSAGLSRTAVVNSATSGNSWQNSEREGKDLFERDVLNIRGLTHAIILLGIEDIRYPRISSPRALTAEQVIASIEKAIAKAKEKKIKVILGTLLPFKGTYEYTEAGETNRQIINTWVKANTSADAVVDFDRLLRSPNDVAKLDPAYDSYYHFVPNAAGFAVMAGAINLELLK